MANKSISMTQVRRIIQLKVDCLSKLKIAESLHIHRATLDNYLLKLLTVKGQKLCEFMGLKKTSVLEEITNKPIYQLDLDRKQITQNVSKRIKRLIDQYNQNERK